MSSEINQFELLEPSFSAWAPKRDRSRQIAVLMSGGVDSSVAAHLLKTDGWDVLGITMKVPVCGTGKSGCCGADAAFVCNDLGIAHYFVDVTAAFENLIIAPFRRDYAAGKTPNPCVDCNTLLKFSRLWDFVEASFGVSLLATGHYARLIKAGGKTRLARAKDPAKDQSYFLCGLDAGRLAKFVLPLGEYSKQQIRAVAAEIGLNVADKEESMELCFAGEGDYRQVLAEADEAGDGIITDMQGNEIGRHKGVAHYTIGQRRGVGFAGGEPLYVGRIDPANNVIALGKREEVIATDVSADEINILIPEEFRAGAGLYGKIRSYGKGSKCSIVEAGQASVTVRFDEAQFAPCPGQKLVLYDDDDNVVAGGTIIQ